MHTSPFVTQVRLLHKSVLHNSNTGAVKMWPVGSLAGVLWTEMQFGDFLAWQKCCRPFFCPHLRLLLRPRSSSTGTELSARLRTIQRLRLGRIMYSRPYPSAQGSVRDALDAAVVDSPVWPSASSRRPFRVVTALRPASRRPGRTECRPGAAAISRAGASSRT